jgi:type II secretory pathway component GspD/PulD (secretin)
MSTKEFAMIRTLSACLMMGLCGTAAAQEHVAPAAGNLSSEASTESAVKANGVPIERVIAAVVKKTGKKFIIDSRVSGNVELLGQEVSAVTYNDLLSILLLNGDTAVEAGNYVNVIPESIVRQMPLPMAASKDNFPDGQFVTAVLSIKNVQAATLVPVLRPLLPVHGHLAAVPCGNSLLLVDNFANVKRIEKLVAALDVGKPYVTQGCEGDSAHQSAASK